MIPPRFSVPAALILALTLAFAAATARADTLQDADLLFKQGQFAQALAKAEQALAAKPRDARARFLKGLALAEMNRRDEAIAVFTGLTEDYPELPEPHNNLAVLYAQQRQFEKARNALEMAIRTRPSYATAHENLGDIYAGMASEAYGKALQIDPANASAKTKLAMVRDLVSVSGRPAMAAAKSMATAKPAEAQAPGGRQDAEKMVRDWAAAWSAKNVKAYLAFYARDFRTPGGEARDAWEAERARRISEPGTIQVSVDDLQIAVEADRATAKFLQRFQSGMRKASTNTVLMLVRREGKWLIQQEHAGN